MDRIVRSPFFIFLLIASTIVAGIFIFLNPTWHNRSGDMIAAERAEQLAREGKREQALTFNDGLIALQEPDKDVSKPAANLFAIPVRQITLDEPEPRQQLGGASSFRGFATGALGRGNFGALEDPASAGVRGAFNNVVIFDKRTGALKKVFEKRTSISFFKLVNRATPRTLVFIGTSIDSNKDGRLNIDDIQKLFVYTIDDAQLREVTGLNASVDDVEPIADVDYLVVSATIDKNKNGEPERFSYDRKLPEPQTLYRVDLKALTAVPLMDAALVNELQAILDGGKPQPPK